MLKFLVGTAGFMVRCSDESMSPVEGAGCIARVCTQLVCLKRPIGQMDLPLKRQVRTGHKHLRGVSMHAEINAFVLMRVAGDSGVRENWSS